MYPDRNSVERLANRLGLPAPDEFTQDWEHEIDVPVSAVPQIVELYESDQVDAAERRVLMELILGAIEDAVSVGESVEA